MSRLIGAFYLVGAIIGLVVSIGGIVLLWTTRADVTNGINDMVLVTGRTIDATRQTVLVANRSLNQASENLALMQTMLEGVAETLDESTGLITSTGQMIGTDLAGVVTEAQGSLAEVEDSARMVDDALRVVDTTLSLLARIPLIGPIYRPRTPLQESVISVTRSLDPLPASLARIRRELDTSAANVAVIRTEVALLAAEVGNIESSLEEARVVAEEYRVILVDLSDRLERFEQGLPLQLDIFYYAVTLLFASMLLTHAAMLIHGIVLIL
jgi:hypothetical protein